VRRGSLISPLMNEAVSAPESAKAIEAQTIMCLISKTGTKDCGVKSVAEPKFHHAMPPITITISAGPHMPTAPASCSQRPKRRPAMLMKVMNASASSAKVMKKAGLSRR